jgi:hypothetical protein
VVRKKTVQKKSPISSSSPSDIETRTRHQLLIDGSLQIEELDIDELQRCRIKNHEGKWPIGQPPVMPIPLQNRINRELQKRLLQEFQRYGIDAIETITDVMYRGEGASAFQGQKDGTKRLDAAKYIIERIVGPIPTKSEISQTVTVWEGMQESGGLFVDVEVTDLQEVESVQEAESDARTPAAPTRKRGPRTRPSRPVAREN